jgi:hypothetical protein
MRATVRKILLAGGLLLGSVASLAAAPTPPMGPEAAVQAAANAGPEGVQGVFVFEVKGASVFDGCTYLDSLKDYRDPLSLNIAIGVKAAEALAAKYGAPPEKFFLGRRVIVIGTVHRIRIAYLKNGDFTGKGYFQTHVDVLTSSQIGLASEPDEARASVPAAPKGVKAP